MSGMRIPSAIRGSVIQRLATAFECAKAGKKVLVLEQSIYFNQSGSSGVSAFCMAPNFTEYLHQP